MALKIQAVRAYGPSLELGFTVKEDQLVQFIADRTGLNRGDVRHMLDEFQDAITFFALSGQGVKLDGLATFLPKINLQGRINLSARISNRIRSRLNQESAYRGRVKNRENLRKSIDDLVALWNTNNPNDPINGT